MSSISRTLDFYTCRSVDDLPTALNQVAFDVMLSSYDTSFDYYKIIKDYEFSKNRFLPIIQILRPVDVEDLRKRHLLTIHKDPNVKLRTRALNAGAADAISYPFSSAELHARLNRLAERIHFYDVEYKRFVVERNSRLKLEYLETDMGFSINDELFVADYDNHLCSSTGLQIQLTAKERLILKAFSEADGEPIGKQQLSSYLERRHQEHTYSSIAIFLNSLNRKLAKINTGYTIIRIKSCGYLLTKK